MSNGSTSSPRAAVGELRVSLPLLLTIGALALASCGGSESTDAEAPGVGKVRAGSVAAFANCRDWRQGSVAERLATIEDLHIYRESQEGEGEVAALSDSDAYELFERVCANEYAAGFKLYKVYARGAAFSGLER